MNAHVFIDALSQALGQSVEKDNTGAYAFMLDSVPVLLHFRPASMSFLLHMEIGYPTGFGGKIRSRLLGANYLLSETYGAAMSLDERTGLVFLEYLLPVQNLDGPEFVTAVEGFVALADMWTKRLHEWNQEIEAEVDNKLSSFMRDLEQDVETQQSEAAAMSSMLRV